MSLNQIAKQLIAAIETGYRGVDVDVVLRSAEDSAAGGDINIEVMDEGEIVDAYNFVTNPEGVIFWADFSHVTEVGENAEDAAATFTRFLRDSKIVGFQQAYDGLFHNEI